ncbi:hypothetical protein JCM11251_000679 [Rhodosporidiobolus azoricus]
MPVSGAEAVQHADIASAPLPLPSLELLTSPTFEPTSDLPLDDLSWRHVEVLCEQSLKSCKVPIETWKGPLLTALHSFESYLSVEIITRLAQAKVAGAEAAIRLDGDSSHRKAEGEGVGRLFGGSWCAGGLHDRSGGGKLSEEEEMAWRELRRARWREAVMLLPPFTAAEQEKPRHGRDVSMDDWTELSEVPLFPVLRLMLEVKETTLGAVKSGTASFEINFTDGIWTGQPLFGKDDAELDEDDLKLVHRLGGTFHLNATTRDGPKLERILELLVFAVVSLKLELHVLADMSCPHPPPEAEEPFPSAPAPQAPTNSDEDEGDDQVVNLPGSYRVDLKQFQTEDWRMPRRVRTSFSAFGASSWLQLISSSPTIVGRRNTTGNRKKRVFSKSSVATSGSYISDPPTTATSPEPERHHAVNRMKNKIVGFGERLKLRKRPSADQDQDLRLQKSATIGTDTVETEEKGWLGGLGMGLSGLGLGNARETEVEKAPTVSPTLSTAPTEATTDGAQGEKQMLKFEKVIRELAEWILSVSPDVLYPPPHILFRLRQQEVAAVEAADDTLPLPIHHSPPLAKPAAQLSHASSSPRLVPSLSQFSISAHALAVGFAKGPSEPVNRKVSEQSTTGGNAVPAPGSSSATRITLEEKAGLSSLLMNNSSLNGTIRHQSMQFLAQNVCKYAPPGTLPCQAPRWVTVPFYQPGSPTPTNPSLATDVCLSTVIRQLASKRDALCAACSNSNGEHTLVLMHHKERIEVAVRQLPDLSTPSRDESDHEQLIMTWTTCRTCHAMTSVKPLSAAAGNFSWAKWCELVLYDPNLVPSHPNLCEHVLSDKEACVRSFALEGSVIEIKLGSIALFELRLPTAVDPDVEPDEEDEAIKPSDSLSIDNLKHEIREFTSFPVVPDLELTLHSTDDFFSSIYVRLDSFEERLVPVPSSPSREDKQNLEAFAAHERFGSTDTVIEDGGDTAKNPRPGADQEVTVLFLLRRLRSMAGTEEAACLAVAQDESLYHLNAARSAFKTRAQALKARLAAWEKKHADALKAGCGPGVAPSTNFEEPEYFAKDVHAFAVESPILVRDGELSSLIALTLSAAPFHDALLAGSTATSRIGTPSSPGSGFPFPSSSRHPSDRRNPIPSEFLDSSISLASTRSQTPPCSPLRNLTTPLDPDDPSADFASSCRVENVICKPRKAPLTGTGSMFRHLMRKRSHEVVESYHASPAKTPLPRGASVGYRSGRPDQDSRGDCHNASAEQDPRTSRTDLHGASGGEEGRLDCDDRFRHLRRRRDATRDAPTSAPSPRRHARRPDICAVAETPRATPTPQAMSAAGTIRSIASIGSMASSSSTSAAVDTLSSAASVSSCASDNALVSSTSTNGDGERRTSDERGEHNDAVPPLLSPAPLSASRFLGNKLDELFSGLDSMRNKASGGLSPLLSPESLPGGGQETGGTGANRHPHEHIKLRFRQGGKTYRVTAYYARRFQALRAKCGLSENLFVESLSRCSNLNPSGGKSSAAFLMTGDKRFMLKELVRSFHGFPSAELTLIRFDQVTKFGVSERETLLNVAPKLLSYLMHPERPSLLARIFGVYTVKITDAKGAKKKIDLVVMEHLFYGVSISRQFDLKGIASRVAKPKSGSDSTEGTGWDGDWLTGSLRDQLLIYPHSKTLLRDALANDVQFLSNNDGIDFSLLIGVDDSRSELVVGLIDTIGVFNHLKQVEYRAKTAVKLLNASDPSAVTVLPPSEYAARFLTAMDERYFVAVPDKWSRPPGEDSVEKDPRLACPL